MSALREALKLLGDEKPIPETLCFQCGLEMVDESTDEALTAAFLMGLRVKGEETCELIGLARALHSQARKVECPWPVLDTCGTGGDGACTLNISTLAAFVLASLNVKVAKHGNRSVTSRCGSADLVEALGLPLLSDPAQVIESLREHNFAFLFAPHFHPATARVAGVRRKLGVRTVFNLLGPLLNPAGACHRVIGVFSAVWCRPLAETALKLGVESCLVVHGAGGLDELTTSGRNQMAWGRDGEVGLSAFDAETRLGLNPEEPVASLLQAARPADWGVSHSALAGGDPEQNAELSRRLLQGSRSPAADTVALNAAAGLLAGGHSQDWRDAFEICRKQIASGDVWRLVERLRKTAPAQA